MSKYIDHYVTELVAEEMKNIKKLRKAELIELAERLVESNLRELSNETIVEIYEDVFHTYVRGV